ncbi:MAG: MMPL family transporter [Acidobacteria bacterium]|nr:MMPL family transporter [Acidobacteriota bacterium]
MASLLYRLGRFSFRRRWLVIVTWAIVVAVVGGAAGIFHGTMSNNFTIPGTETQQMADKLAKDLPKAAGGSGSVVFTGADGKAITADQQKAIATALTKTKNIDGVQSTVDPFATETKLKDAEAKLKDGQAQLDAAKAQAATGKAQLDAAAKQLTDGQAQLDAGKAQLAAQKSAIGQVYSGTAAAAQAQAQIAATQAHLDAAAAQLAQGQAAYDANKKKYDDGVATLDAKQAELNSAKRQADAANGLHLVSNDSHAAVAQVQFKDSINNVSPAVRQKVQDVINEAKSSGVNVYFSKDISQDISQIFGTAEVLGVAVAAAVLIIMLGTLIAAGLPLLMALIGVGIGVGGTFALTGVIDMSSTTPMLGLMLGLAVGIDYCLFIINRHRHQLLDGMEMEESVARAIGTSGNAVLFAGLTVIIALSALVISGLPFLAIMGLAAAATVAVAVLVALTLTPAMLSLAGKRVISKRAWAKAKAHHAKVSAKEDAAADLQRGNRGWGALVTRHPVLFVVATVVALAVVAIPAANLRLALPDGGSEPVNSSAYKAYKTTGDNFGQGVNGPIIVVGSLPAGLSAADATSKELDIADKLRSVENVTAAVPVALSDDRQTAVFQVIPTEGPASASTVKVVQDLRAEGAAIKSSTGASIGLTGQTAANVDVSKKLGDALPLYLAIVVGLSLILLLLVFRSILVPLLATGGFLLSLAAAFGGVVAVYQWGWLSSVFDVPNPGAVLSFLPILVIGVLFGLAMDYQMFITSGMREAYVHGQSPKQAVRTGFSHAAAVVTAAAIIMTSVFSGFIFSHLTMVRPLGFALAFGVLLDAFVVRMTLVPAAMQLLGKAAWWMPKWLERILPDVDVEGAKLAALGKPKMDPEMDEDQLVNA